MHDAPRPDRTPDWAFCFALEREARPFLNSVRGGRPVRDAPCRAQCVDTPRGTLLALITGPGAEAASRAVRWLLDAFEPRDVIVCGYAGALVEGLAVGDLVLASEVVDAEADADRVHAFAALGEVRSGRILTWPRMIARAADKRRLGSDFHALAVDMESAAIVQACRLAQRPCAVLRVISDTVETTLAPELERLLASATPSLGRVLTAVARRPRLMPELWRLARDTRFASRQLARTLRRLID